MNRSAILSVVTPLLFSASGFGDVKIWSTFQDPSSFPNPDPKYKQLGGSYVYYEQQNAGWTPDITAKGMYIQQLVGGEYELTEIRIAQPAGLNGGTISVWTVDVTNPSNPVPGVKRGEVSASTTIFSGEGGVIESWDFSSLNVLLTPPGLTHYLVFDSPMAWYQGFAGVQAWNQNGAWKQAFNNDPIGPAFEVRGNKIPAPGGLAVVMLGGVVCASRRRR